MALRYADAMTRTPVVVPDAVFDELRRHYTEPQIVELTSLLAWENYRARFNHALEIESEGFTEGAFCPLPVTEAESRPREQRRGAEWGDFLPGDE